MGITLIKNNMKKIHLLAVLGIINLLTSCSNKVDFGEQYKKIVYIVNSKETVYYSQHDVVKASKGNISIYVTGSELPAQDIKVSYKIDTEALEKYNKTEYGDRTELYFSLLPENLYSFQTPEITIPKGEPYGCLEFTINTQELLHNKIYILPITIDSAEGAEISENLHTILYVIQIQNEYAGNYISSCSVNGIGKGDFNKKVTAVSSRKIMLPLANLSNTSTSNTLDFNKDYYLITINEDNTLILEPYLQSIIYQKTEKRSYYDPENRIFHLYYDIEDKYENRVSIEETLKAI